jgi:hypothetical protein
MRHDPVSRKDACVEKSEEARESLTQRWAAGFYPRPCMDCDCMMDQPGIKARSGLRRGGRRGLCSPCYQKRTRNRTHEELPLVRDFKTRLFAIERPDRDSESAGSKTIWVRLGSEDGEESAPVPVLVDQEDYEWLNQWSWALSSRGYASRLFWSVADKSYRNTPMHRAIMEPGQGLVVDHISRDKLDNRRCNLRCVNPSRNQHNQSLNPRNKAGYTGVQFCGKRRKSITRYQGVDFHHGLFDTPEEAAAAREAFVAKL